ncbi:hypothetical protein F5146DRAFT_932387 [Armillaria mellea]|nr:hypothetical protein F5146DRAFT_932387 [Armillaria mellea]
MIYTVVHYYYSSTPILTTLPATLPLFAYGHATTSLHSLSTILSATCSKMFIGGLNWDTTDEGLRDYFSQFGKVDAVTIMRDPSGTSRGFAFLTFEDPAAVQVVTAQDHFLDGKAIDPKRAIPREEHLRNTRYFVGGLAPSTTSDSMKEFFSVYGKVVDATVMLDRESGRSKGFGFVTFEDAANSDQLVGKNLVLDDKQIEVKTAQPRSQREQARNNAGVVNNMEVRAPMPFIPQQPNPMSMMYQRMPMLPPMMGMNPMMMGQFHPMAGMGMMGMGMGMGGMRLGMGPMGVRGGMNRMAGGVGPSRVITRGQHSFHPYAR